MTGHKSFYRSCTCELNYESVNNFSILNSVCSDCNLMNCDCVLVNSNCGNSDSDSRPEGLGLNFSVNENTHGSSHLIQQSSSCNTETHPGSKDESYLNLNLSNKDINVGFLNVQGLCSREMTKFSEIELFLAAEKNKNIRIFGMCETKLKNHKPTSAFQINGFKLPFRKDNDSNGGGGILVCVRDPIMSKRRDGLEINDIACLWLEITPEKGKSFLVGNLYRNPSEKIE